MPFSSGTYTVVINFTTEAGSPPIEIAKLDAQMQDIATALSTCMLRDGTGTPTAPIPFGSQNLTGVGTIGATVITGTVLHATAGGSDSYESYRSINAVKSIATQETGSFVGTLTGCTTSPTANYQYSRVGGLVTICCSSGTHQATSNSTGMTITGLPAALQPSRNHRCAVLVIDAGITVPGSVLVASGSGTLTFHTTSAASYAAGTANIVSSGFTNTATTKGIHPSMSFTYHLD